MSERGKKLRRTVIALYLVVLHATVAYFAAAYFYPGVFQTKTVSQLEPVRGPGADTPVPTPLPIPSEFADQLSSPEPLPSNAATLQAPTDVLMIPVKGVKRDQLLDTFTSARSEGRTHDAIDIMAPGGTPVVATADGEIIKFFDSVAGGVTIYELSTDGKYIYYYAHLQKRAEGLSEHNKIARGTVIGYVGDTGNAGAGNYHLHFAIATPADAKKWSSGPYINPYPLLKNGIESP